MPGKKRGEGKSLLIITFLYESVPIHVDKLMNKPFIPIWLLLLLNIHYRMILTHLQMCLLFFFILIFKWLVFALYNCCCSLNCSNLSFNLEWCNHVPMPPSGHQGLMKFKSIESSCSQPPLLFLNRAANMGSCVGQLESPEEVDQARLACLQRWTEKRLEEVIITVPGEYGDLYRLLCKSSVFSFDIFRVHSHLIVHFSGEHQTTVCYIVSFFRRFGLRSHGQNSNGL